MKKKLALILAAMITATALVSCGADVDDTTAADTTAADTTATDTTAADTTAADTTAAEETTDADTEAAESIYVTVVNGDIELAYDDVALTDADSDGAFTVNDALYLAHEENFDGGAAAGYATEETQYGTSLVKLWGVDNGGSYGYLINNASAMSLNDEVKAGDHVVAYVYTDLVAWSDTYTFFDAVTAQINAGEELTLTLSMNGYDADWNPVVSPVAGAVITFDGVATEYVTDADGKVTITPDKSATVSAVSDAMTMVAPICVVTVK